MKSANIPHLYSRNGIYYYRNNSVWKYLRTRCKKEAFRKLSNTLFGTTPAVDDTSMSLNYASITSSDTKLTPKNSFLCTSELIKDYLAENANRWCAREYTRIKSSLGFLPKDVVTRQIAIELKAFILQVKAVTTGNHYFTYFNASYHWALANYTRAHLKGPKRIQQSG